VLVAGGGTLYSEGGADALTRFAEAHGVPVAETQAGKGALPWDHPLQAGPIGVTGGTAANALAHAADVVIAVGTRLQDFTTGSHSLFPQARIVAVNVNAFDAIKGRATVVQGDAALTLDALSARLAGWRGSAEWRQRATREADRWRATVSAIVDVREVAPPALPYDGEVIGAVQRTHPESAAHDIVVCAAGTLPGELHKLWRAARPGGYHVEYGYSCMGYEIAGGIGVKMARPQREVIVMVGDGSYLMLNSEIATSVMLGTKLIVVVEDNRGYGCIHRLQQACGGEGFNNLFDDCVQAPSGAPVIDYAAHARALGAIAEHVDTIAELEAALARARAAERTSVIVIDTDPLRSTAAGGWWWEVGVPEVSESEKVRAARAAYEEGKRGQRP
jgi:3D-(3,5/4)-trihydroxycyclohexane-1,2-dione acylhydrolase (decyclizing)